LCFIVEKFFFSLSLTKHSKTAKNLYLMNGLHFIKGSIAYTRSTFQVLKAFENALESQLKHIIGDRA